MQYVPGFFDPNGNPRPLLPREVARIEGILRAKSLFCFQAPLEKKDQYSMIGNAKVGDRKRFILYDRNIASDIANLFNPNALSSQQRYIAVAIILFQRLCEFMPAPLPALQEFESQHPGEAAYQEITAFGRAMCCTLESYLSVLNGERDSLTDSDVSKNLVFEPFNPETHQFVEPYEWVLSYCATLKLILLKRDTTLSPLEKMIRFLQWVKEHFFFMPPLTLVASQFFSPKGQSNIIKRALTNDTRRLREEARNAAWDLSILFQWHHKTHQRIYCLLASCDAAMREIAGRLLGRFAFVGDNEERVLEADWGRRGDRKLIMAQFLEYSAGLADPSRAANQKLPKEHFSEIARSLEQEVGIYDHDSAQG